MRFPFVVLVLSIKSGKAGLLSWTWCAHPPPPPPQWYHSVHCTCTMYKASACKTFVLKNPILKDKKLVTDLVPCQLGDFKLEVGRRQTAAEKNIIWLLILLGVLRAWSHCVTNMIVSFYRRFLLCASSGCKISSSVTIDNRIIVLNRTIELPYLL